MIKHKLVKELDGKIVDELELCDEQLLFIKTMLDALSAAQNGGGQVHYEELSGDAEMQAKIAQAKALGGEIEEVAPGLVLCKIPRTPEAEAAMAKTMSPGELNKYRWQK